MFFQANVLIADDGKACIADFGLSSIQEHCIVPAPRHSESDHVTWPIRCRNALKSAGLPQSLESTLSSALTTCSGAGTFRWMSPERLLPEGWGRESAKPTFQSDIFSFAMLVHEVSKDLIFFFTRHTYEGILHVNRSIAGRSRFTKTPT